MFYVSIEKKKKERNGEKETANYTRPQPYCELIVDVSATGHARPAGGGV